ncbi:GNAT family N-acetyltransferase [Pseudoalteromonas sp. S16_S37]|uniref:GNAT family N-acetyltransferase n=1 Tax=Pseudoalteromonas sp. S16_S37 TaxID=2720228 RepID=UPI0016809261|nr:GNAT family N-acetyltransferase [Pseudoalteromonas sp. S16_S37]MBD1582617.1 GNAT family N-acetyltransferase [Pseudoalteromonas sp. S16_S37]
MICRVATRQDITQMHQIRMAVKENMLTSTAITQAHYIPEIEQTGKGWVVEVDDEILGFGIANKQTRSIWALFVDPNHEGKGFGKALLNQMVNWLWQEGVTTIQLGTDPNTRAEQLYLKAGWQCKGLQSDGELLFELNHPKKI